MRTIGPSSSNTFKVIDVSSGKCCGPKPVCSFGINMFSHDFAEGAVAQW